MAGVAPERGFEAAGLHENAVVQNETAKAASEGLQTEADLKMEPGANPRPLSPEPQNVEEKVMVDPLTTGSKAAFDVAGGDQTGPSQGPIVSSGLEREQPSGKFHKHKRIAYVDVRMRNCSRQIKPLTTTLKNRCMPNAQMSA